ncbi:fibronectin-like isoform X2 [Takifugu rubripes]|uniref:fibronectin-like isoform X2 n=1 Tax=Takifugu rubripes TaxID=31033 RepID=UPI001145B31B|nr:fibronectin-like isoform X2 [Takifugu rubripes]
MQNRNENQVSKPSGEIPHGGGNAVSPAPFCRSVPPQEAIRVLSVEQDSVTLAFPLTSTSAGYKLQVDYSSDSHAGSLVMEDYKAVQVPNLRPDCKYTFTIKRIAEDGRQSIATSLWAPTDIGSLTQIKVYHTSLDSLSLSWTPPAGEVKKYMVTCRKGQEIVQELTTTDPHITVTDLEPEEFYHLEVSAEFVNGRISKPAMTTGCTRDDRPTKVAVHRVSQYSLLMLWTPPAGEVKKYLVTCRKGQEIVQELTTTDPHITVTDLQPKKFYNLEVSAEFVNGRISKPAMTTGCTRDDRPTKVAVHRVSQYSLLMLWTPPAGEVKKYLVTCRKGQKIVQELTTTDPHITVTDLEPKKFYNLEVSAEFVNGRISKPAMTTGCTHDDRPTDVSVHRVSQYSLLMLWTPPAGEVKKYMVTCRKGQKIVQKLTTTAHHITVTDLEPKEFYNLEVSAEFVNGRISKPAMTTGWTRDDRPTKVAVYHTSLDSLSLCWTPPAGEVKKYVVTCRKGQKIVQALTTTDPHITVTDLEPEVFYNLEVSAEFVNGRISKPVMTTGCTRDDRPTKIGVHCVSPNSLLMLWTPPAGQVKKYMVTCHKGQEIVQELTTTDPHITVTDLEPKEFYNLEVSAEFVNGRISKPAMTTGCTRDDRPTKVAVYHTSLDSLSLCWTPPAGEVKKYVVTCRKGQKIVQALTTTDPHITVTDLEPEVFYDLEVSAEFVNGRISKPAMTTGCTRDDRPTKVGVHCVSPNSLLMLWTPPAGQVKKYMVTCHKGQEIVQELTTTDPHITVTDLEPKEFYNLEVSAEFVNGRISKPARVNRLQCLYKSCLLQ